MNYQFQYGNRVICLPERIMERVDCADETAVKVLFYLASGLTTAEDIAVAMGCDLAPVQSALAFWHGAGVLEQDKQASAPTEKKAKKPAAKKVKESTADRQEKKVDPQVSAAPTPRPTAPTELPRYTTEEMSEILDRRADLRHLIDDCSRVFGKIFSSHETNVLLGLLDHLNISGDYLLLLLAHCVKMGKRTMRYVESCAISLYDEGITDTESLQECLKQRELRGELESKVRQLFGIKSRALTTKESKMLDAWISTMHYGIDVITLAFEKTVSATGEATIPYANSILERWHAAKLKTLDEITAAEQAHAQEKMAKGGSSFNTDDFFDAALKRSFGEDFHPANSKK